MLRKTLVTLVSVAALGLGSAAMAAKGGGGGGGGGGGPAGGMGGGGGIGGGASTMGAAHGPAGGPGLGTMGRRFSDPGTFNRAGPMSAPMTRGPMTTVPITRGNMQGWNGQWGNHHNHFHNRFHNRNFFAFGFGGPIYDYAYGSCWSYVPTAYGWQYVYVCGDYYGYGY